MGKAEILWVDIIESPKQSSQITFYFKEDSKMAAGGQSRNFMGRYNRKPKTIITNYFLL
nr:MAG TPA: hypothetical protein [Siphoviridae sp. cta6m1]